MSDQYHRPHVPSGRSFTIDNESVGEEKKSEILSAENNNVALSVTDTICCREVEHDVITCALWLEEILWMGSNLFPCVCWGTRSHKMINCSLWLRGKRLEYDDQDDFSSMLHLFPRPFFFFFFFSCPSTRRDKGEIQVMSCLVFSSL